MEKMKPALFSLLILLLSLCLASSCSMQNRSGSMESVSLSSGMDKKATAPGEDYSGQYRDSGGEAYGTASTPMAAPGGSEYSVTADMNEAQTTPNDHGTSATDVLPDSGRMTATVQSWLVPTAWAEEHNLDDRYIVRNGNIEMEIEDYEKSASEVRNIAERHGGMITDTQMEKYGDDTRVGSITLRVPGDKFMQAFEDLKEIGDVKVQSISSEDVSNQYIAGVSRMKSLKIEQETLQGMLADAREIQRSRGLGEAYSVLLDTQSRLSQVTTELQNVEDRISALADRITRSTIRVNLSERVIAPPIDEADWSVKATIQRAKRDLQHGMDNLASGLVYFLINGLIWWVIWLGIFWLLWVAIVRRLWLKFKNYALADHKQQDAGPPAARSDKSK